MMVTAILGPEPAGVRTLERAAAVGRAFTIEQLASIRLAVAQWLRSARGVAEARDELRRLHVAPDEIVRRRRAESEDAHLATILRLAVTAVITGGTLEASDRRRFGPVLGDDVVQDVVKHAASARRFVAQLERSGAEPAPVVDLDVGDY